MEPPTDFRKLTDDEWRELESRADRFASALRAGGDLDWEEHLAGLSGNVRHAALHEFIKIDLESTWKRGGRLFLDDYLRRFPELGGPYDLPVHLVYEEYRIRTTLGDKPEADSYLTRFPHIAETLRGLLGSNPVTKRDVPSMENSIRAMDQSVSIPKEPSPESVLPAVGQYQLIAMLGRGQFGEVWRAKAPGGVEVAVKVITQPSDRETAKRELQALELVKNLRHPCLMATLAFWEHLSKVYIVIELADGTLRDRLDECKKEGKTGVSAEELLPYFQSAAEGLDFLHSKHVYHRDIKPDNILLMGGHAKVADFGLARAQDRADMSVSFAGTPVYMAPEVWGGKFYVQSDLYSLAMTYAELRMGRRPLDGKDFVELMSKQLDQAPDLKGLPEPERAVLVKALAKNHEKRQTSCRNFVEELRAVAQGGGGGSRSRRDDRPPRSGPPIWLVILGVFLLIGAGVTVWAVFLRGDGSKPTPPAGTGNTKDSTPGGSSTPTPILTPTPGKKTEPPQDPSKPVLPTGYTEAPNATIKVIDNRRYHTRIERGPIGGIKVTFLLIVPLEGKAFYVLETKAWNGLMAELMEIRDGDETASAAWRKKPADGVAVGMPVVEAVACAKCLGGRLPTPKEWDLAVGFTGQGTTELIKSGKPGVGLTEPRRVTDPDCDVATTGIKDATGNGREWTSEVLLPHNDKTERLPERPGEHALVILRGRNFTLARPLTVGDLTYEQTTPQTQYAGKGSKYTGFRVVIPID
jgi:serine/threonine protein kinase